MPAACSAGAQPQAEKQTRPRPAASIRDTLTMFLRYLDGRIAVRPLPSAATLDDRFG